MWRPTVPPPVSLPDAAEVRLRETLAANVRRLRLERGMTVEHAAARGPLDARHWQKIETASVNVSLCSLRWTPLRDGTLGGG